MIPMGNNRGGAGGGRNFRTLHSKSSISSSSSASSSSSSVVSSKISNVEDKKEVLEKKEEEKKEIQSDESIKSDRKDENSNASKEKSTINSQSDEWNSLLNANQSEEEEKQRKRSKEEEQKKRKLEEEEKKKKVEEEEKKEWRGSSLFARELCCRNEGYLNWRERFGREFLTMHYGEKGEKYIFLPMIHNDSVVPFDFSSPSPDDLVFLARKQSFKQKKVEKKGSKGQEEEGDNQERPDTISFSESSNSSSKPHKPIKKKKVLSKDEGRNDTETLSFKTEYTKPAPLISKPLPSKQYVQMSQQRRKEAERWRMDVEKDEKQLCNVAIMGQFNGGKSTLLGHLCFLSGLISQQLMHKGERESNLNGKPSYSFAYLFDELEEERKRWMTMDYSSIQIETQKFKLQMIDTPGYVDFTPNAISACSQADSVILVVDATQLETEHQTFGQTKELISIARSFGINQIGVVVNKMSLVDWSQKVYDDVVSKIGFYLKQAGMKENQFWFLPTDALSGENLLTLKEEKLKSWYSGPTLQQQFDLGIQKSEREHSRPFRMCLSDLYKSPAMGFAIIGRVETGLLSVGDKLIICPQNQIATVKTIKRGGEGSDFSQAGDFIHVGLQGVDASMVGMGSILCDPERIISPCYRINAQILTFTLTCPILPGQTVEFHYLSLNEAAVITRIISTLEKGSSKSGKRKPRMINSQTHALIEIQFIRPICLETSSECKPLGRFILRWNEKSIARGIVTEIDQKFQPGLIEMN